MKKWLFAEIETVNSQELGSGVGQKLAASSDSDLTGRILFEAAKIECLVCVACRWFGSPLTLWVILSAPSLAACLFVMLFQHRRSERIWLCLALSSCYFVAGALGSAGAGASSFLVVKFLAATGIVTGIALDIYFSRRCKDSGLSIAAGTTVLFYSFLLFTK